MGDLKKFRYKLQMNSEFDISGRQWILAQEGSRQGYGIPVAFNRLGKLRLFYTDIWCRQGRNLLKSGSKGMRSLAGRYNAEIPSDRVVSFSTVGLVFKTIQHFQHGRQSPDELGDMFCRFGRWFALRVRNHLKTIKLDPQKDIFFGFDTNSLEALELLKERGVMTILDQVDPAKLHEDLVIEEAKRWPGWQKLPGRLPQSYWDRRQKEWELADLVLVNSEWSQQAIIQQGVPKEKIIVVPLALDLHHDHSFSPIDPQGDLKVLWLGNVVLGKGIQYLVEAARLLLDLKIEILLAGPMGISPEIVASFPSNIKVLGRVTRDKLSEVYNKAHLFVLPTISDGFALTQLEAMAHGLPVVITPNCGRVVTDGWDGLIVPPRDSKALADAIARLDVDRDLLRAMSCNALRTIMNYDLPTNAKMIIEKVNSKAKLSSR